MKVFISWSGNTSHLVAKVLRDWLPNVIQTLEPYVSSEDIDKGARWSSDIAGELNDSSYGIICLTKQNIMAPWINFEAGALGKSVDKSNVSPFLFRMKPSDVFGPITQFQSTKTDREDILKLLQSLNTSCGEQSLAAARLETIFDVWWPKLEEQLNGIPEEEGEDTKAPQTKAAKIDLNSKILEELLELTRTNHQILRDPTQILPPNYMRDILSGFPTPEDKISPKAYIDLIASHNSLRRYINKLSSNDIDPVVLDTLQSLLKDLMIPIKHIDFATRKLRPTLKRRYEFMDPEQINILDS